VSEDKTRSAAEDVLRRLDELLASSGWSVSLGTLKSPRFSIVFEHPLTPDVILSLDSEKNTMQENLDRFLEQPEFARIKEAPRDVPHAALMRAIRENAKGLQWPTSVTERLALILEKHGLLTEAEAEWLEEAGSAWSDAGV
jgi:hypothetical protein